MGAALSGGQQARVFLARVLYAYADVALLDEPLAALDPATSDHVWRLAIRGPLLQRSSVIVTSSSVSIGSRADYTLILEGGSVLQYGIALRSPRRPDPSRRPLRSRSPSRARSVRARRRSHPLLSRPKLQGGHT